MFPNLCNQALVLCPRDKLTKSFNLFKDRIGGGGPDERPSVLVMVLNELVDLADQISDAPERSPANGLLGNEVKPDLHLIEPGCIGGGIVNVITRASRQPTLNSVVFVGS